MSKFFLCKFIRFRIFARNFSLLSVCSFFLTFFIRSKVNHLTSQYYRYLMFLILYHAILIHDILYFEAGRGADAQSVTVKSTGCGFDPHSRKWNIYLHLYLHLFALVSRHEVPSVYPAVCGIHRKADLFMFKKYNLLYIYYV